MCHTPHVGPQRSARVVNPTKAISSGFNSIVPPLFRYNPADEFYYVFGGGNDIIL